MKALILAVMVVPVAANAAASRLTLLAGQTLHASPGLLAQEYPTPPPPPPTNEQPQANPSPPSAGNTTATLAPEGEPPGLGAVLGYMISGGIVAATGVGLTLYGLVYILFAGAIAAGTGTTGATTAGAVTVVGVVFLIIGLIHDGVGAWLLIKGNGLRVERNAYNEAHNITDLPPRAPSANTESALAFRF